MDEPVKKRVDESWKEQAEREKQRLEAGAQPTEPKTRPTAEVEPGADDMPQARFDLFISGLAMEALIAVGDMPHPTTRKQAQNLPQAKYLIDLLGLLEEKTKGNLSAQESKAISGVVYELQMRYVQACGGGAA